MQSESSNVSIYLATLTDEVTKLKLRVESLEGGLAQAAKAGKQPIGATKPKIHGREKAAMVEHHPPLEIEEINLWKTRIPEGRRFKTAQFSSKFFPGEKDAKAKSRRVTYWLRKAKVLSYDAGNMEHYRPVSSDVNVDNAK